LQYAILRIDTKLIFAIQNTDPTYLLCVRRDSAICYALRRKGRAVAPRPPGNSRPLLSFVIRHAFRRLSLPTTHKASSRLPVSYGLLPGKGRHSSGATG